MSLSRNLLAASALALSLTPAAFADRAGTVDSASGDLGDVIVTRDGQLFSLTTGDPVMEGDIIATRRSGGATISVDGCTITLDGLDEVTIDDAACNAGAIRRASIDSSGNLALSNGAIILGVGAGAVLVALAADDDDDNPVSP